MTAGEYLEIFANHLRVGEQKRQEFIAELRAHLAELDQTQDIATVMGEPQLLARAYNTTHLGAWRGAAWMFLTPFVAWWLIVQSWARWHNGWWIDGPESALSHWWHTTGERFIPLGIAVVLSWFVVHQLSRRLRPWRTYVSLLIIAFSIGTLFFGSLGYKSQSGMLDMNRLVMDQQPITSSEFHEPVFRDRVTGLVVTPDKFQDYTTPVSPWSSFGMAALMNAIVVGTFALLSGAYIIAAQHRTRTKE